jgi:hypothetical protein
MTCTCGDDLGLRVSVTQPQLRDSMGNVDTLSLTITISLLLYKASSSKMGILPCL